MTEFALESVVKMLILIVAAFVIIGLMMTFSQDIYSWWLEFTTGEKPPPKAQVIEKTSFIPEEVANFIESCWSSNLNSQEDNECYFLLGDLSGVSRESIIASINADVMDPNKAIFDTDSITDALVITYDNYRGEIKSAAIVVKGR